MKLKSGEIVKKRYVIEREIYEGGICMVYTCIDILSRIKYVIKHPVYRDYNDDYRTELLKGEARTLRTLFHQYIVDFFDSFEENNVFYSVIEYISGKNMDILFENRPATEAQARIYCGQLLTALEYLHNQNIIHRDIKPFNIRISGSSIKIIDFCSVISPGSGTDVLYTPGYGAPEQMRGEYCFQSDIYGVGATLYFLLTGKHPPMYSPLSLCGENPQVDKDLDQIVRKATEMDPNKRFQTAAEMKEAILGNYKLRAPSMERDIIKKLGADDIFEYDIAISFAGENRETAENLARKLQTEGIRVFYDEFYKHDLWGKKLTKYFQDIYGPKTKFVVVLISRYYPIKDWTDFEFSTMRKEAEKRQIEFILPVRLDDTKILGIFEDIGYLDFQSEGADGIVDCILKKLSSSSFNDANEIHEH